MSLIIVIIDNVAKGNRKIEENYKMMKWLVGGGSGVCGNERGKS